VKQPAQLNAATRFVGETQRRCDRDRETAYGRGVLAGVSILELEAIGKVRQPVDFFPRRDLVELRDYRIHRWTPPFGG
jgi:hypothetical protein